jgi:hypothetical protein
VRWIVDQGEGARRSSLLAGGAPGYRVLGWRSGTVTAIGSAAIAVAWYFIPNQAAAGVPIDVAVILPFFVTGSP